MMMTFYMHYLNSNEGNIVSSGGIAKVPVPVGPVSKFKQFLFKLVEFIGFNYICEI
jgi:hypothetical protein